MASSLWWYSNSISSEPSSSNSADPVPVSSSVSSKPAQSKRPWPGPRRCRGRLHGAEGDFATAVGPDGQHGGADEIEEVPLPEVGLNDPPPADELAVGVPGHALSTSFGRRTRSYAAAAKVKAQSTFASPRSFVWHRPAMLWLLGPQG
jgi:hypothetical protein